MLAVEWSQGVTDAWTKVAAFVPKLFGFLVILVVGYLVAAIVVVVVAGSAVIAIGGGGIKPMRQRWEQALQRLDEECPRIKHESQGAPSRIDGRAQELKHKAGA